MERRIRKFSETINESQDKRAGILEIAKKLGFNSLEEIKKEKNLLTKLESLLKELGQSADVSEDAAEDIEAKLKDKDEEKSLEDKAGEKEEDGEVGGKAEEVDEDAAEDIEAKQNAKGEPEAPKGDEDLKTKDQDIEQEIPDSSEDDSHSTEIPKARIMSFEEFVENEKVTEEVIDKKVSYQDDEEEDEDNALPVAEDKDEDFDDIEDIEDKEKADEKLKEDEGIELGLAGGEGTAEGIEAAGVAKGQPRQAEEDDNLVTNDQDIAPIGDSIDDTTTQATVVVEKAINEKKIENAKDFEEYAMAVLMKAHPDDFDEEIAKDTIAGLTKKYKDDFGAMIGALSTG